MPAVPVVLLDLSSTWTTRAGGNQALCCGDRVVARQWARTIHRQLSDIHGLTWASSVVGGGRCVALSERAQRLLPVRPELFRPLDDPALHAALSRSAIRIGFDLI